MKSIQLRIRTLRIVTFTLLAIVSNGATAAIYSYSGTEMLVTSFVNSRTYLNIFNGPNTFTGSMEFSAPLGNLEGVVATSENGTTSVGPFLIGFSFTDGITTITSENSPQWSINVITNSSINIDFWDIKLNTNSSLMPFAGFNQVDALNRFFQIGNGGHLDTSRNSQCFGLDVGGVCNDDGYAQISASASSPDGTWILTSTTLVPVPAMFWSLALALVFLTRMSSSKKR